MLKRVSLALACLTLGACSSTGDIAATDARDPYENTNRKIYEFNMAVDTVVLEPAARGYRALPSPAQTAISNHVEWTSYPSTAVNSTLQGKFENAALATIHFLINGLTLGFVDLTEDDDDPVPADFGQTMASWSVPEGSYVMMPLLGPGTVRSHTGFLVDAVTNPLGFMNEPTVDTIRTAQAPAGAITFRGNNFDQFNEVKYNSADPYSKTRSIYYQYREGQLRGGNPDAPSQADDAFENFLNEDN